MPRMNIRRVVTGHDANGKAIVTIDEPAKTKSMRAGVETTVVWTSEGFPVDNSGDADESEREVGTFHPGGTVFRIVEFQPGNAARVHRTDSIDYAVVMSGEIDMELEEGDFVHLRAGDVLVQRGTLHSWVYKGSSPCVIAFSLIDAKPVEMGGNVLHAMG